MLAQGRECPVGAARPSQSHLDVSDLPAQGKHPNVALDQPERHNTHRTNAVILGLDPGIHAAFPQGATAVSIIIADRASPHHGPSGQARG